MPTFNNGESGASVREKLNEALNKVDGVKPFDNDIEVQGGVTATEANFSDIVSVTGNVDDLTVDEATLKAIAQTKSETAVDVFVYDTSLDSDGGAWRHRTQHTSWYNEPLNTATRGGRREFPAVAVIVAESDRVTIYDGDDPSLPMWMVFPARAGADGFMTRDDGAIILSSGRGKSTISAKNARLAFACARGADYVDFLADTLNRHPVNGYSSGGREHGVALRGEAGAPDGSLSDLPTAQATTGSVHWVVSPSAPVSEYGLAVPHLFVGSEQVVVVRPDGTAFSPGGDIVGAVNEDGSVYFQTRDEDSERAIYITGDEFAFAASGGNSDSSLLVGSLEKESYTSTLYDQGIGSLAIDYLDSLDGGYTRLLLNRNESSSSMLFQANSSFATGWMPGEIKGAFLSDTDDTDLVGSGELVTNGTFDTDLTGWSVSDPTLVYWDDGRLLLNTADSVDQQASTTISTTVGDYYRITVDHDFSDNDFILRVGTSGGRYDILNQRLSSTGTYERTFKAQSTTTHITMLLFGTAQSGYYIDNVSVERADADRSVNNNGLIVNGTITREPVAPGADLVAYSGFSSTNYLEQPYNPDLDFGTGDFCVMGWVNLQNNANDHIFERAEPGSTANRFGIFIHFSGEIQPFTNTSPLSGGGASFGTWDFITMVRRSGTLEFYRGGALKVSQADTNNVTNANAVLAVGAKPDAANPLENGSLALLRISATAPTAEQIKRIYEDEKVLFQENAKATLYGSSDAVTALAHDPVTGLLHVGSSDGRSVFQGLRRVENTTTPVNTAISASNNLIVED